MQLSACQHLLKGISVRASDVFRALVRPLCQVLTRQAANSWSAFISCDANASLSNTEGVRPRAMRGTVRTALVSLSGIEKLSERDDVHRISPAIMMKPLNDLCARRTRLPVFRNNHPEQGRDVLIGIVDSGIDATHPAFQNRIECIWDQTIEGRLGHLNYGTVLRDQDLSDSRDTHNHDARRRNSCGKR